MTAFRCEVVTREGRVDHLQLEAPSRQAVAVQLISEGMTPIRIKSGTPGWIERLNEPIHLGTGFGVSDQALLLTQLAALVRAGLPIDRSLDLLVEQAGSRRKRATLRRVFAAVRAGDPLSVAFEREEVFPLWVVGVLRSVEQGGGLGEALTSLALRMNELTRTRRELVSALTYPAAVLAATLIALILVLLVVVPQFKPIFAGQEARLPVLTQAVLWLSDHAMLALGSVALTALVPSLVFVLVRRSARASKALSPFLLHLPGARLREHYLAAQFAGLLSTLLASDLTLVRTLPLTASGLASRRWQRHLRCVELHVREGTPFSRALALENFVPVTLVRLLEVGERTGKLGQTAQEAGRIIDDAARARLQRIISLANPAAIVSLGAVVALLVAGVMLGIFAIGDFAG